MDEQDLRTERVLRIAEDVLRQRVIDTYPEIRSEVDRMTDLIRELVRLEREKAGLDDPRGMIELVINQHKKHPSEPDATGNAKIAGRFYQAIAWRKTNKIKIALLPPKRQ